MGQARPKMMRRSPAGDWKPTRGYPRSPMLRIPFALALVAVIAIGPSVFAQEQTLGDSAATTVAGPVPAVVVDTTPTPIVEDAWTFRFLVPTVLVVSGLALVGALAAYGVRVRGRYRVAR